MVDKSTNSDYGAYSSMYDGSHVTEGRLYFFGKVMAGVRLVSESFNVFQVFCILAGSYVLWELFHFRSLTNPPSRKLEPLLVVALLLYASLFFVEFYVIRLRAGLSICFFTLSVIALLKVPLNAMLSRKGAVPAGWFTLSILIHDQTAMMLCLMTMPAMFCHHLQFKPKTVEVIVFIVVTLVIWTVVFDIVSGSWVWRGADLRSPLNPFRLVMSAVVPLLILVVTVVTGLRVPRSARFPFYVGLTYGLASFVLICFSLAGILAYDGEAVVRIMTLSSVGSLISIFGWGLNLYSVLPAYVGLSNALFFLNTIFLQLN